MTAIVSHFDYVARQYKLPRPQSGSERALCKTCSDWSKSQVFDDLTGKKIKCKYLLVAKTTSKLLCRRMPMAKVFCETVGVLPSEIL